MVNEDDQIGSLPHNSTMFKLKTAAVYLCCWVELPWLILLLIMFPQCYVVCCTCLKSSMLFYSYGV